MMRFSPTMKYVDDESAALAQQIERKLSKLPPDAGIIFVAVDPTPVEGGKSRDFRVHMGVTRALEEGAVRSLLKLILDKELKSGLKIYAGIHRGVSGTRRDDSAATACPPATEAEALPE